MNKNNKKKILFISTTLSGGGSERVVSNYANFLSDTFVVKILLINNRKTTDHLFNHNKRIEIIYLKKKRLLHSIISLRKNINVFNPDYIFTSIVHLNIFNLLFKLIFNKNYKTIIREANLPSFYLKEINFSYLYKSLCKLTYNKSDLIITSSNKMMNEIKNLYKLTNNNIKVLKNPIDRNVFFPSNIKENDNFLKIILVGRLVRQKNIINLIKSMKYLSIKKYKLTIYGEGILRNKILKEIKDNHLEKNIEIKNNQKNIARIMQSSDLLISCSLWEGMPNVILEALSCGLKVYALNAFKTLNEIHLSDKKGMKFFRSTDDLVKDINDFNKFYKRKSFLNKEYNFDFVSREFNNLINSL